MQLKRYGFLRGKSSNYCYKFNGSIKIILQKIFLKSNKIPLLSGKRVGKGYIKGGENLPFLISFILSQTKVNHEQKYVFYRTANIFSVVSIDSAKHGFSLC